MKAKELKDLIVTKQHYHALNHKVMLEEIEDKELRKACKEYLEHCKKVDRVIKAAIAREKKAAEKAAVNSQ